MSRPDPGAQGPSRHNHKPQPHKCEAATATSDEVEALELKMPRIADSVRSISLGSASPPRSASGSLRLSRIRVAPCARGEIAPQARAHRARIRSSEIRHENENNGAGPLGLGVRMTVGTAV
eukprot:1066680-Prymnesium_polylepis.1